MDSRGAGSNDQGGQGKFGIGISGSASINTIIDNVDVAINDAGEITAQDITLAAENWTDVYALSGGVVIKTSSQSSGLGIAGAFSWTNLGGVTTASIIGSDSVEGSDGILRDENGRPQPWKDAYAGRPITACGMSVTIGGLKKQKKLIRFWLVVHNTIRGSAGNSILNAEFALKNKFLEEVI